MAQGKFHVTKKGEVGRCVAEKSCPLGGDMDHYDKPEDARKAYEKRREADTVAPVLKKGASSSMGSPPATVSPVNAPPLPTSKRDALQVLHGPSDEEAKAFVNSTEMESIRQRAAGNAVVSQNGKDRASKISRVSSKIEAAENAKKHLEESKKAWSMSESSPPIQAKLKSGDAKTLGEARNRVATDSLVKARDEMIKATGRTIKDFGGNSAGRQAHWGYEPDEAIADVNRVSRKLYGERADLYAQPADQSPKKKPLSFTEQEIAKQDAMVQTTEKSLEGIKKARQLLTASKNIGNIPDNHDVIKGHMKDNPRLKDPNEARADLAAKLQRTAKATLKKTHVHPGKVSLDSELSPTDNDKLLALTDRYENVAKTIHTRSVANRDKGIREHLAAKKRDAVLQV